MMKRGCENGTLVIIMILVLKVLKDINYGRMLPWSSSFEFLKKSAIQEWHLGHHDYSFKRQQLLGSCLPAQRWAEEDLRWGLGRVEQSLRGEQSAGHNSGRSGDVKVIIIIIIITIRFINIIIIIRQSFRGEQSAAHNKINLALGRRWGGWWWQRWWGCHMMMVAKLPQRGWLL